LTRNRTRPIGGRTGGGDRDPRLGLSPAIDARARVEIAVGVLMELCGSEATKARSRLVSAALSAGARVETVAEAILALGAEHPKR
jgi:AmiR/NasT family two-component response regulator